MLADTFGSVMVASSLSSLVEGFGAACELPGVVFLDLTNARTEAAGIVASSNNFFLAVLKLCFADLASLKLAIVANSSKST